MQPEAVSLSNPVLVMKIVLNKDFVYGQVELMHKEKLL